MVRLVIARTNVHLLAGWPGQPVTIRSNPLMLPMKPELSSGFVVLGI